MTGAASCLSARHRLWVKPEALLSPLPLRLCRGLHDAETRRDAARIQLTEDAVADPVLVPPLDRIHLHAVDLHAEVYVNAAGEAGLPRDSKRLSLLDHIAHFDAELAHVAVDRLQRIPVVKHPAVAGDAEIVAEV